MTLVHTIGKADVGKRTLYLRHGTVESPLGIALPTDVGKRVWDVGGVLQVENDAQRDQRLADDITRQTASAIFAIDCLKYMDGPKDPRKEALQLLADYARNSIEECG